MYSVSSYRVCCTWRRSTRQPATHAKSSLQNANAHGYFLTWDKRRQESCSKLLLWFYTRRVYWRSATTIGRNISQIFLEIFEDFLGNFLRISVGFGVLMRKWEIFPKHSFSRVFRNCSAILFLNSQRFLHHFPDFPIFFIYEIIFSFLKKLFEHKFCFLFPLFRFYVIFK